MGEKNKTPDLNNILSKYLSSHLFFLFLHCTQPYDDKLKIQGSVFQMCETSFVSSDVTKKNLNQ